MKQFDFETALELLGESKKVRRAEWGNKEIYLFRMSKNNSEMTTDEFNGNISKEGAYIVLRNMQGDTKLWNATEKDKNGKDWEIITTNT